MLLCHLFSTVSSRLVLLLEKFMTSVLRADSPAVRNSSLRKVYQRILLISTTLIQYVITGEL